MSRMSTTIRPRTSKADLERGYHELTRTNTVLIIALQCVLHEKPDAVERWHSRGDRYEARLYHATGVHGGIVVVTFCSGRDKQPPHTVAYYLEDWHADARRFVTESNVEEACAADRLWAARNRLCAAEVARS